MTTITTKTIMDSALINLELNVTFSYIFFISFENILYFSREVRYLEDISMFSIMLQHYLINSIKYKNYL